MSLICKQLVKCMSDKFIDTNFDSDEYVNPNEKYLVFVLSNTYSLFNAIYYAIKLTDFKCIAIWDKSHIVDFDIDFAKKYFYKYYFIKDLRKQNNLVRLLIKVSNIGYFRSFSQTFKFLNKLCDFIVVVFNDNDTMTQAIIDDYGNKQVVLLCDEGCGAYNTFKGTAKSKLKYYLVKILTGITYEYNYLGSNKKIKGYLMKYPELLDKAKSANKILIKANNPFDDDMFVKLMNKDIGIDYRINQCLRYFLYLGSPITELGVCEDKEIYYLKELIGLLGDGEKLLIKLHPRENINKYNRLIDSPKVEVLELANNDWIPIELIVKTINVSMSLSVLSSAILSLSILIPDIYHVYLYKLFGFNDSGYDMRRFKGTNICVINSINEIKLIKDKVLYYKNTEKSNPNINQDIEYLRKINLK